VGRAWIGISGWRYAPWRGVFYPPGLPQRRELEFASRRLATIEINGSFYRLQRPEFYAKWSADTPPGFLFSVKAHRYITHILRLKHCEEAVAKFFGSGPLRLGPKLGPFLWQFPPSFKWDPPRMKAFLELLPRDAASAEALAKKHRAWMPGAGSPDKKNFRLRHAFEIRNESFKDPAFAALLRRRHAALVVADTAGKWPLFFEPTADFMYLRLHGDVLMYVSGYGEKALNAWAARIRAWARKKLDVYCYFDNDVKVRAPFDSMRLAQILGALAVPAAGFHDPRFKPAQSLEELPLSQRPTFFTGLGPRAKALFTKKSRTKPG
jgi:uncharacterized protein YecE (DUF72 family)